jgi:hypothetical protein
MFLQSHVPQIQFCLGSCIWPEGLDSKTPGSSLYANPGIVTIGKGQLKPFYANHRQESITLVSGLDSAWNHLECASGCQIY